ncbi:MAG: hypothetical protein JEZ03_11560 [Bacteroidales bacterium]|nr:hypothetical protein [Bacteroidales bacterium]
MEKTISILGCGWLGFPLALQLIQGAYIIKGSTRTYSKLEQLEQNGIKPYLIELGDTEDYLIQDFLDASVLIINIPPSKAFTKEVSFFEIMNELKCQIEKSKIEKVILVSSTSVLGDREGELDEETIPNPETDRAKELYAVEQVFTENHSFDCSIVRFAGLIGPGRHPGRFLSGRIDVPGGNSRVNLIHLDDCIGIISKIIDKDYWNEIIHAAAPIHPIKKDYYTEMSKRLGLTVPLFHPDGDVHDRIVVSSKIATKLDYSFKIENLIFSED